MVSWAGGSLRRISSPHIAQNPAATCGSRAAGGATEPTVTRAYYLNFQAADPTNSRWALVLDGGLTPQPIYRTFVRR